MEFFLVLAIGAASGWWARDLVGRIESPHGRPTART